MCFCFIEEPVVVLWFVCHP